MNTSSNLEILRSHIGKEFTTSPSPFMHWLQPIVIEAEKGKLSFEYTVRKDMTNPMGILHGGVTAAIADDIIGATLFSLDEDFFYTTINNVVDYFAPGQHNEKIIASTSILKKGNQIVNAQCEIWNADKTKLLARATSNLLKTNIKKNA